MPRYDFVSPGAMATNAIEAFLLRRDEEKRRDAYLALEQQRREAEIAERQQREAREREAMEMDAALANADIEQRRQAEATKSARLQDAAGMRQMIGVMAGGDQPLTPERARQISLLGYAEGVPVPGIVDQALRTQSDDYTLTPGSARFRGSEQIASVPATTPQLRDERLVQVAGPNGTAIWVRESEAIGKPAAQAARSVTGSERQTLAYYNRAKDASETITKPTADGTSLEDRVAKSGLGTQIGLQYAPNLLQTKDQQAYRQAQRAFTEARLRKESGAAIPTAEYENDSKTYFAQPGDTPDVIAQKRQARQVVLDGLKFGAGKAYGEFYGETTSPAAPRVGDVKTFPNGRKGRWDGTGWEAVSDAAR